MARAYAGRRWLPGALRLVVLLALTAGLVMPVALRLGVTVQADPRDDRIAHLTTDAAVSPRETSYDGASSK